jgi:hypothetical protein
MIKPIFSKFIKIRIIKSGINNLNESPFFLTLLKCVIRVNHEFINFIIIYRIFSCHQVKCANYSNIWHQSLRLMAIVIPLKSKIPLHLF